MCWSSILHRATRVPRAGRDKSVTCSRKSDRGRGSGVSVGATASRFGRVVSCRRYPRRDANIPQPERYLRFPAHEIEAFALRNSAYIVVPLGHDGGDGAGRARGNDLGARGIARASVAHRAGRARPARRCRALRARHVAAGAHASERPAVRPARPWSIAREIAWSTRRNRPRTSTFVSHDGVTT